MEKEHTPAEIRPKNLWKVSDDPELPGAVVVNAAGHMICDANVFGTSPYAPTTEGCLANAECIASDHNACLGIKDPETTVPELVAALREVLVADLIPNPPDGHVYTLVDADSDEGRAIIVRARAVLAKTEETR